MAQENQHESKSPAVDKGESDKTVRADFADAGSASTDATQQVDFAVGVEAQTPPTPSGNHVSLPRGYVLQEYTIEAVLGVGGFGITYLAQDNNLQCRVALKEYLPNDLAIRTTGQTVIPRADSDAENYRIGLDRFLAEARVLATFRHHNIVRVSRFFEANHTAYMVMDYEKGESLRSWVDNHGSVTESDILRMFLPLLEGLETVHRAGVVHRDIKPANIYVRDIDGSLVLLDFGAARQTTGASSKSLTSIITPGYAPFEQYHTRGAQGPWTDLYALGGVLYWLATGQKPIEAPSRVRDDPMIPAATAAAGRYGSSLLSAVDWALAVDESRRPHSVADFRAVLTGASAVPAAVAQDQVVAALVAPQAVQAVSGRGPGKYAIGVAGAAIIAILGAMFARPSGTDHQASTPPVSKPETSAVSTPPAKASVSPALAKAPESRAKTVPAGKSKATQAATATLTFEIVPAGESAELIVDEQRIGRVPPLTEYRLPPGKHKIKLNGNKRPNVYHYWVDLAPNEKKKLWAKFSDE